MASAFAALAILSSPLQAATNQTDIILDADTANEVDDLFAVVRALIEPTWNVTALNAAQWQPSQWASAETMEDSHRLNQHLVGLLELNVPTKRGGHRRMYDWGDQAVHSAAAYEIIRQAHLPREGKLQVVVLGALTNVASALFIDPSIADKLHVYWLGSTYDFDNQVFGTTDFNCMMDIQALHLVLKSSVELNIIPVNVATAMKFDYQQTYQRLDHQYPLNRFLIARWDDHIDGGRASRTIWDLGLITAIIKPEFAKIKRVKLSKSYGNKWVNFYQSVDGEGIRNEFFEVLDNYLKSSK